METTLVFVKPDGVQRGMVGRIIAKFEDKGLQIVGLKMMQLPRALAEKHYKVHKGKPFYPGLIKYVTSGPIVVMALRGFKAIEACRKLMGATFGFKAEPGTIRGDFGISGGFNLVHGSDSPEAAAAEIALYFRKGDLCDWTPLLQSQVYDPSDELK